MKINEKQIRNYLQMLNEESIKKNTTYQYEKVYSYNLFFQSMCASTSINTFKDRKRINKVFFHDNFELLEYIDKEMEKYK